ncbi:MAG TPA: rhodanese-like domain-containing protein [Anaeromyxobacteraceae bacterium]|nr:rhodanese-like domain-containing protein [Anaeromyxobacteraceae bacterium]
MEIPRLTPRQVMERLDRGASIVFVDVRGRFGPQCARQIPGSVRIDPDQLDDRAQDLHPAAIVVAYCDATGEVASGRVAIRLRQLGYSSAFALAGGLEAWQNAHYPLEPLHRTDAAQNTADHQVL